MLAERNDELKKIGTAAAAMVAVWQGKHEAHSLFSEGGDDIPQGGDDSCSLK